MPTLDFESKVAQNEEAIRESPAINDRNTELLLEWSRDLKLSGLSDATIQKRTAHMKVVAEHLGENDVTEMDKADVKDLVEWIQSRDTADSTKEGYKKIIRFFWRWLWDHEDREWDARADFPPVVDWIDPDSRASNDVLPEDLLTPEDIQDQIDACYNARDEAIVAFLYETGARIGEVIDLTLGAIEDRQKGKKVVIDGKTGPRRLPLKEAVPHLNRWLNEHPTGDPADPLWTQLRSPEQLSYNYIRQKILGETAERAGLDKPVNPHHYRHSRASYLANKFTEAQLCEWFGWVQGSDQPAKYVHLSGRDIDAAFDELHGEEQPSDTRESYYDECPRCDWINAQDVRFCGGCGLDLIEGEEPPEPVDADSVSLEEAEKYMADVMAAFMRGFNEEAEVPVDLPTNPEEILDYVDGHRRAAEYEGEIQRAD